jgi:hypothetical protein
LSTLAFSTLHRDRRTDAAGLYSLVRQLGFASGVALMTAVLRARVEVHSLFSAPVADRPGDAAAAHLANTGTLGAYRDCFLMMAIASVIIAPGILLFRIHGLGKADKKPA